MADGREIVFGKGDREWSASKPSFGLGVSHILGLRPVKEMVEPDAGWIVATMKHLLP